MLQLIEMDSKVSLRRQMDLDEGPVVLINVFTVAQEDVDRLLSAWSADAAFMKTQPGFISTQLHRGIAGSCVFLNYAIWESVRHFRNAFTNPVFQAQLQKYPPSVKASPHLFKKLAVPGICVS